MYLVQIGDEEFVNAENIDWIMVSEKKVNFTLSGDPETTLKVKEEFQQSFVNHLQALNSNISNVESAFHKHQKLEKVLAG